MKFDKKCFINGMIGALVGLFVLKLVIFVAEGVVKTIQLSGALPICEEAQKKGFYGQLESCKLSRE